MAVIATRNGVPPERRPPDPTPRQERAPQAAPPQEGKPENAHRGSEASSNPHRRHGHHRRHEEPQDQG